MESRALFVRALVIRIQSTDYRPPFRFLRGTEANESASIAIPVSTGFSPTWISDDSRGHALTQILMVVCNGECRTARIPPTT